MSKVARRHHFLPQGYLAGFTDNSRKDGMLHVLNIETQASFRTSPINVAVENDFKRIDIEGRSPDELENALSRIEGRAIAAIRAVISSREFPSDEGYNLILNLISLVIAQNPKARRALNLNRARAIEGQLSRLVSSPATWEHHVAKALNAGENLPGDLSYERARRFVDEQRYQIAFDNVGTLQAEFDAQDELLNALSKRTWSVLVAPDDGPYFICSDYPCALTMEPGFHGKPGFLLPNTELFFPLSKALGFIGTLGRSHEPVVRLQRGSVAMMNRRIARQADRHIFVSGNSFCTYEHGAIVDVVLSSQSRKHGEAAKKQNPPADQ
ncbi:DUF4238 domain-containing protein [Aquabacterium sp.]|uniref:DUF4238 domain-containing protein n=1 Tax=Aquabacterium sp. TaxID=1872578 RepID=UPI004038076E